MIMDCGKYVGPCECGRDHELVTKKVVVEYNAFANFERYMEETGLTGRRTVIYDSNTYNNPWIKHVKADQEIVLDAEGLHSEKGMIEDMMTKLDRPEVLVAVGSGTIMDFGRYPAYKLGIPFAAIPTLFSADGYTANICSIIIDGQKKSIPMVAPTLVVTDLDVIAHAPMFLTVSGVSDILAKYISLADWKIAKLVSGEYYCPMVAQLSQDALDTMRKAADTLAAGGEPDFEAMTMAQMMSGLTMQLLNHSRAASGAEHLMKPPRFEKAHGMHGQCVGVGTYLCAKEYHRLASLPTPKAKPFQPLTREWVEEKFGPLADGIMKENANDVLGTFDPQNIVDNWEGVKAIIAEIPSAEELAALYEKIGALYKPEDIGIDPALSEDMLSVSAAIRNRLTLIRMRRVLDFGE
jgi:glycerol-1-phosphate dehydrogenase [NAD(P)+]